MKPDAHSPPERANRSLSDARRQLGRAIGDALSGSLGALSERLRGNGSADTSRAAAKSKYRLREVLSTDRSNVGLAELNATLDFAADTLPPSAAELASAPSLADAIETPAPADAIAPASAKAAASPALAHTIAAPPASVVAAPLPAVASTAKLGAEPRAQADTRALPIEPSVTIAPVMMIAAVERAPTPAPTAPAASEPVDASPPVRRSEPAPSRPQPSAADEPGPSVWDEPIRTRSMARLLASQGHHQRALAIYDLLLTSNGADASLRAEVDALRGQLLSA